MTDNFQKLNPPGRIQVNRNGNEMTIAINWFNFNTIFITLFTLVWNFVLFSTMLSLNETSAVILIFVLFDLLLTYYAIAKWFNCTYIIINSEKLVIYHQPMAWFGSKELRVGKGKELGFSSRWKQISYRKTGGKTHYYVIYVNPSLANSLSKKIKLIELEKEQEASFITTVLNEYFDGENDKNQLPQ